MKKLLALFLSLVFVFSFASAESFELDPFYAYAHAEVTNDGAPFMSVIYFAEDGTCYFLAQMFFHDHAGYGRTYVGTWEYTPEGYIHAKTGDNTDIIFKVVNIAGSVSLVDRATLQVYEQFSILMK